MRPKSHYSLLLMGYRCWNLWIEMERLQPPLLPGSGRLLVSRCQLPSETWAAGVQNTEAMAERPWPGHTRLVPLALRILPASATCQSSCQVRETWMRSMYCTVTAKEIPTYTRFIGNVDLLNLRQGGWGRDLNWVYILRTQRLLFL